jgi:hypothetical protein
MVRIATAFCLAAFIAALAGCGSGQAKFVNDLKQTGLAYHQYHDQHQQGPPGWNELIAFDKSSGGDGQAITRVRDAGYQMQWNVKFSEVPGGLSNAVMADKPGGGPKIMMDGSVQ